MTVTNQQVHEVTDKVLVLLESAMDEIIMADPNQDQLDYVARILGDAMIELQRLHSSVCPFEPRR